LARQASQSSDAARERCELCSEPIPSEHRHLLEVATHQVVCACRACSILFDREAASEGRHRLIPDRRLHLDPFQLTDGQWESLRIPVGIAFFFRSTPAARVIAQYPSPLGPTESLLALDAWADVEGRNQPLRTMLPDVEALLVNRARGARQHFLVPIDDCFRLVAIVRARWRGFGGGQDLWEDVGRFFVALQAQSRLTPCT
jgi:hypothetical protein